MHPIIALVIAGGVGFGLFYGAGWTTWQLTHSTTAAWVVGMPVGVVVGLLLFRRLMQSGGRSATEIISSALGTAKDVRDQVTSRLDEHDSHLYGKAEEELQSGSVDKGLWAHALVKSDGNEEKRKAEYLKLRAKQLKRAAKNGGKKL
ncbi:MAG: multidrug resistance efflux transporter family protein [Candidatus Berkelbacteria bacterium]|nr:multidrug resistance efflux transporter family protein [Candidatus Berkelbacteria bacterium]